jgi:hypothetical protein
MTFDVVERSVDLGSPVETYEFNYQSHYLRYTTSAAPCTIAGQLYTPYPFKRDKLANRALSYDQPLTITAHKGFPVAALFKNQAPSAVVSLVVRRMHVLDGDAQFIVAWTGRVLGASWDLGSSEVTLTGESDLSSMKAMGLRRMYAYDCPWVLYGAGCELEASVFAIEKTIFSVSGRALFISDFSTDVTDTFGGGFIEYYDPLLDITELIAVRSSNAGTLNLVLNPTGLAQAPSVKCYPGCAHNVEDCLVKFNNLNNYGGQPDIPGINPFAGTTLY